MSIVLLICRLRGTACADRGTGISQTEQIYEVSYRQNFGTSFVTCGGSLRRIRWRSSMKTTVLILLLACSVAGCYTQLAVTRNEDDEVQRDWEQPIVIVLLPTPSPGYPIPCPSPTPTYNPPPAGSVSPPGPSGPTVRTFGSTRIESTRGQSGGRQASR